MIRDNLTMEQIHAAEAMITHQEYVIAEWKTAGLDDYAGVAEAQLKEIEESIKASRKKLQGD